MPTRQSASRLACHARPPIRPVHASDVRAMRDFVDRLSSPARRCRFHGVVQGCSEALARRLVEVDGMRHVACVATVADADGVPRIVGEARYVIEADDPTLAEFAIAVADDWQGRGVADRLIAELLERAHAQGVRWLCGEVLGSNHRMLGFVRRLGFHVREGADEQVMHIERSVELPLHPAPAGRARWLSRLFGGANRSSALVLQP